MLRQALQEAATLAHQNYKQAFSLMEGFWPPAMLPCRVMGYVYQKNLAKIEAQDFVFNKAVKLTKFEKLQMVFYALFKTLF